MELFGKAEKYLMYNAKKMSLLKDKVNIVENEMFYITREQLEKVFFLEEELGQIKSPVSSPDYSKNKKL